MKQKSLFIFLLLLLSIFFVHFSGCAWINSGNSRRNSDHSYKASQFVTINSQSGIWLDVRAEISRKQIYVLRTGKVPDSITTLVAQGLAKIIKETGRSLQVATNAPDIETDLMSADWFQEKAMLDKEFMHGKQADAGAIIDFLRSHDKTNDHFVVLITDSDLTSGEKGNNYIYGMSSYPYIVISARRFIDDKRIKRGGYAEEIYDEAVSLVAAHEFAHYLDLVQRDFNGWRDTDSLLDNHCKGENGDCLMQQTDVNAKGCHTALEEAKLIFGRERWLCLDCAAEVGYRKEALLKAGYFW